MEIDQSKDKSQLAQQPSDIDLQAVSADPISFTKSAALSNSIESKIPFPVNSNIPDPNFSKHPLISSTLSSIPPNTEDSQLTLRALVTSREAGILIGKGGKKVAQLREFNSVKAGISKVIPGNYDRVLSITGHLKDVAKAYEFVAKSLAANHSEPQLHNLIVLRILISHSLMGTIIGKQGAKIKTIQDKSGTKLIAAKEMLPQSTERIIEIHGPVSSVFTAVYEIGKCLIEDWERGIGTVLYNPSSRVPSISSGSNPYVNNVRSSIDYSISDSQENPHFHHSSVTYPPGLPRQRSHTISNTLQALNLKQNANDLQNFALPQFPPTSNISPFENPDYFQNFDLNNFDDFNTLESPSRFRSHSLSFAPNNHPGKKPSPPMFALPPTNIKTQEITIPGDMVGCIIGKAGSRISEIRRLSKTRIEIAKSSDPSTGDRLFTITGTPKNVDVALFLISGQLDAEQQRRNANAQLAADLESLHPSP
ncbi:hypothetical protein BB560_000660 [Smittium megazygosporum]|uniref:K Homology domain-containing protein n=1 Tax=Smittium megazygosporum TaxID=133381 RepID=A0A2T9ZJT0_9FUNG|nr:hypothetical protein BB560_000660 [Smittium megazygosporum]